MTMRIWTPILSLALVTAVGCKKDETVSPDEATDDTATDDADDEADDEADDDADDEADEMDAPAVMTKASFDETVHEHFDDVSNCYLSALEANPELAGTFTAEFTFDAEGVPTSVTAVEGSTLADESLTACVAEASKGWRFDQPKEPGMTMRYDYKLEPAE